MCLPPNLSIKITMEEVIRLKVTLVKTMHLSRICFEISKLAGLNGWFQLYIYPDSIERVEDPMLSPFLDFLHSFFRS